MPDYKFEDLTPEQFKELNDKASKAETLEKERSDVDTKLKEYQTKEQDWEKDKKDLEQAANPNWIKTREVIGKMKDALKTKGIQVDEEGNILNPGQLNIEEITQRAAQAARGELLASRVEDYLHQYDGDSAKLVKHFYNKLVVGEEITLQNVTKFLDQAHRAAELEAGATISPVRKAIQYSGGQGPRSREESEGKLDDATAKELGAKLGLGFVKGEEQK